MRKIYSILLLAVMALCFLRLPEAVAKEQKIGFIDLSKAFDEYQKTKDSEGALGAESEKSQNKREEMVKKIRRLKDELELLSEKGRKEKEQVIDKKVKGLKDFDKEVRAALREKKDSMVREILKDIDKVVQEFGKKESYAMILNDRVLLYADEQFELTEKIIKILNARYKEKKGK